MTTRRQIQVAEEIQQIVSVLLQRDLKDPRIGFVTVIGAEVTQDIKYATISVSVMGTPEEQKQTMDALVSSRGFIRRELASRLSIRAVPELRFKLDRGAEYSSRINQLLNEIKEADAAAPDPSDKALPAEAEASNAASNNIPAPEIEDEK
ncbi:MAG: 30S ribosome-binding factor RbfA [Chloroflexota bacterium]|nr:30S ribosome-binding factor RbfA [Chloroflexota bacterium]